MSVTMSIKAMILLWQVGVVDTLTMLQFCVNCGSQYTAIVAAEDISPIH